MGTVIHLPTKAFVAHHTRLEACDCGCGTLKFLACDENDKVKAVISHDPAQWLEIVRAIAAKSLEMMHECEPPPESA